MTFLNLFPIPRKYAWLTGAAAFALTAAAVVSCIMERSSGTMIFAASSAALLVLVYVIRLQKKKEWKAFCQQENARLLQVKGSAGPSAYIPVQREKLSRLRNPELKAIARLNLASVLAADAKHQQARAELEQINPQKLDSMPLQLLYWSQMLCACIYTDDAEHAKIAHAKASDMLAEAGDVLNGCFIPYEVQYDLYCGEYECALSQLESIPEKDLDAAGKDMLRTLRTRVLWETGALKRAAAMAQELSTHDLIPSTRALLNPILGTE